MPELIIKLPNGHQRRHRLGATPHVIGRDATCEIAVDDPGTSRRHAVFSPTSGGYEVEDLGSKNGTLVNNTPRKSWMLKEGDRVTIGTVEAVYTEQDGEADQSVVISDDEATTHATRYVSRDQQLDLSRQRLQMIYELGERLTTLQGQEELLDQAMNVCLEMLNFERGAVGVRRPNQRGLDWPVVRDLRGAEGELTISRSLLNRALEHGERAIFTDEGLGAADPTVSMVQHGIRSAMCVPLMHKGQILGVIYGDRVQMSGGYSNEDVDFLGGIAHQVSIGLVNCRLLEEQQKMARINRDIDLARTIQTGLFPAKLPARADLRVAAVNEPGQRISGDYYDVIEGEGGRVWCLVADVTGEGVAAALLMANLQAAVRVTVDGAEDPAALLSQWNRLICRNTPSSKFITCVLASIDPQSRQIQLASAGHCPPIIVRSGGAAPEEVSLEPGFPLGVDEEARFETKTIRLAEGPFALVAYTDGVTEAANADREMYGMERLAAALSDWRDLNPQGLVKHVRADVASFVAGADQSDDITILAVRVG